MGFDGIKNKSASMGKKPMSAFLKVNKYENPQTVLDLISHICTSGMDLSVRDELRRIVINVVNLRRIILKLIQEKQKIRL